MQLPPSQRQMFLDSYIQSLLTKAGLDMDRICLQKNGCCIYCLKFDDTRAPIALNRCRNNNSDIALMLRSFFTKYRITLPEHDVLVCTSCVEEVKTSHDTKEALENKVKDMLQQTQMLHETLLAATADVQEPHVHPIDWSICFLCQKLVEGKKLIENSTRESLESIVDNVKFMDTHRPDLVTEVARTAILFVEDQEQVVFHHNCRVKYSSQRRKLSLPDKTSNTKRRRQEADSPPVTPPSHEDTDCPPTPLNQIDLSDRSPVQQPSLQCIKALDLIRDDIKQFDNDFDGSFTVLKESPTSLLQLVSHLVEGQPDSAEPAVKAIADMILFNSREVKKKRKTAIRRKSTKKESSSLQYRSIYIYSKVKSETLFDFFYESGFVFSYDRIRSMINMIVSQNLTYFATIGAIAPLHLKKLLFTISAVDNVDKTARNTSGGAMHGTSISLFQQENGYVGVSRFPLTLQSVPDGFKFELPDIFKLPPDGVFFPATKVLFFGKENFETDALLGYDEELKGAFCEMETWLINVQQEQMNRTVGKMSCIVYFSGGQGVPPKSIHALLPLILESPNTKEMTKHTLDLVLNAVNHLNPGQTLIDVRDQPLYALAKGLQLYNNNYSMKKVFLMMGPLHIEQVCLEMNGELLKGTGIDALLDLAGLSLDNPGAAVIGATFVTRARYILQVLLVALASVQHEAFLRSGVSDKRKWIEQRCSENNNFYFWNMVVEYQTLVLLFVRSLRESNLTRYRAALSALCTYFFALDHYNYARWVPVNLADFVILEKKFPDVYNSLTNFFTISKTRRISSAMGIDQAHEQANERIKNIRGGLAFMSNSQEESLLKWSVYGPEFVKLLQEYEHHFAEHADGPLKHHEDYLMFQKTFCDNCEKVKTVIGNTFNPFTVHTKQLCFLNNGQVLPNETVVSSSMRQLKTVGKEQYVAYIQDRLVDCTVSIGAVIPKNSLFTPSKCEEARVKEKKTSEATEAKIVRHMRHASQYRPQQVLTALRYEPDNEPRVFVVLDKKHASNKSSILSRLKAIGAVTSRPMAHAVVFDLSSVVHVSGTKAKGKRIADLCSHTYADLIKMTKEHSATSAYIVGDRYDIENPLKGGKSTGTQISISLNTIVPTKFQDDFLRNTKNKERLYDLLIPELYNKSQMDSINFVISHRDTTLGSSMPPSNHYEADYKMVLYVIQAIHDGAKRIVIRTGDTDVVVIMIGQVKNFLSLCPSLELYIMLKSSSDVTYYDVRKIACDIGLDYCKGFMLLYSYTGCDYTPSFSYHGKTAWYDIFAKDRSVKETFEEICSDPNSLNMVKMQKMINFTLQVYGVRDSTQGLLEGRLEVLKRPNTMTFRALPPSPGAAIVQARKAIYVAGHVWAKAHEATLEYPDMSMWGWRRSGDSWLPIWTVNLPPSSTVFEDCYRRCSKTCKCKACDCKVKYKVKCLPECGCKGEC